MTDINELTNSAFLKRAIAELDFTLEEELQRYQYWRKHGRAPIRISPRSKKRPSQSVKVAETTIPPEPLVATEISLDMAPPPEPIATNLQETMEAPIVSEPEEDTPWIDWQTMIAGIVLMIVVSVVGYLAAQLLQAEQWFRSTPPPAASPSPESFTAPPVIPTTVPSAAPSQPPISVGNGQGSPVVFKVVVEASYLDRVQQIVPEAVVRNSDGKIEVKVFQDIQSAEQLVSDLLAKDIPAKIE